MKYVSLGLMTAGVMLTACGGKLNEKTALKALQEAQEPVRFSARVLTDYSKSHYDDNAIYYNAYQKAGLIGKLPRSMDRMSNELNLNTKKINKKGWDEYIEYKPAGNDGQILSVYNYMSRPGKVLRINSKPVDRLCDAVAEYTYERYDYAPWGKELEKKQWPTPTVWQACMIKYDKSWGVKNWNKKKTARRR